jgi:polygalacturonase
MGASASAEAVFDVDAYGAKSDNATDNTAAFRAAISAAAAAVAAGDANTRSTVTVNGPGTYLTGALNLSTRLTLSLAPAATVAGVRNATAFPVIDFLPSYGSNRDTGTGVFRHQALLMVPFADGARVVGGGTLDGNGAWWGAQRDAGQLKAGRPHLLEIFNSTRTELADVTLANSAFWTLHPVYSRGVHVHGVTIDAPCDSSNSDGIDPDSSSDVLIENVTIACGDDHIAIKSGMDAAGRAFGMPSTNITVRNATFLCGRGISIGSEVSGGVEGVLVEGVRLRGPSKHGMHLKTSAKRGGYIRDVLFRDIVVGDVYGDAVLGILTSYGDSDSGSGNGSAGSSASAIAAAADTALTDIRNIRFENISRGGPKIDDKGAGAFGCFAEQPCENVTAFGVHLDPARGWTCSHVHSPDAPGRKTVVDVSPGGLSACLRGSASAGPTVLPAPGAAKAAERTSTQGNEM